MTEETSLHIGLHSDDEVFDSTLLRNDRDSDNSGAEETSSPDIQQLIHGRLGNSLTMLFSKSSFCTRLFPLSHMMP